MGRIKALVGMAALAATAAMLLPMTPAHAGGQVYIRAGVGYPSRYPVRVWAGGYWHHGWYGPRFGWWWVVGPSWYYYPTPVYPYPNPYNPPVVINTTPAQPGPAPEQYWYYCAAAKAYYPYVSECPGGWQKVPVTPPSANTPSGQ